MRKLGFSLIELLVVVVIIGVLAGAGIVGYQVYINGVQQDQAINILTNVDDALGKDVFARQNDLSGASLTQQDGNLDAAYTPGACESLAISTVEEMNALMTNPFGDNFPTAIYGNFIQTASDGSTVSYTIEPGTVVVACADPTATVDDAAAFRLYQCVCTEAPCGFTSTADWNASADPWNDDSMCARPVITTTALPAGATPENPNP